MKGTANMNTRSLAIAAASGALLNILVSNVPYIGLVNCLLCAGFWGSAFFAVWLYRRLSGTPTVQQSLAIGAITGAAAGVLGFALSFAGLTGLQGLLNSTGGLLPPDASKGFTDIPAWGVVAFNVMGIFFDIVLGVLGGWLAGAVFNRKPKTTQNSPA